MQALHIRRVVTASLAVLAVLAARASVEVQATENSTDKPAPPSPATGTVTATALNVRALPGTGYERIDKLPKGTDITVVGERDGWYEVRVRREAEAWCAVRYIDADGRVSGDRVRVRAGPGLVFSAYATLNRQDRVEKVGDPVRHWQQIHPPASATAWVSKTYVNAPAWEAARTARRQTEAATGAPADGDAGAETGAPETAPASATVEDKMEAPETGENARNDAETPAAETEQDHTREGKTAREERAVSTTVTVNTRKAAADTESSPSLQNADDDKNPVEIPPLTQPEITEQGPEAVTAGTPAEDAAKSRSARTGQYAGMIVRLNGKPEMAASHVLVSILGRKALPKACLRSTLVDLEEWEKRRVRIYGKEIKGEDSDVPTVVVTGIQLDESEQQ